MPILPVNHAKFPTPRAFGALPSSCASPADMGILRATGELSAENVLIDLRQLTRQRGVLPVFSLALWLANRH